MKVAELTGLGLDAIRIAERKEGPVPAGHVRLRIKAAALNFRDVLIAQGIHPLEYPRIPLSDAVGEVVELGACVSRVGIGDRVCPIYYPNWIAGPIAQDSLARDRGGANDGVAAESLVIAEAELVKVPAHLSDAEAATLPCAAVTAWSAVTNEAALRPGQTVLVQGTGGVSLFALQFALLSGAETFVISSSIEKLSRARALGAHHTLNYREIPDWGAAIADLTHGRGVDIIVDVGGSGTFHQAIAAVAHGGQISQVGLLTGASANLPVLPVLTKGVHIDGIIVGGRDKFEEMIRAIALHQLHPVLDRRFRLAELPEALQCLAGQGHFGKVTVDIA